MLNIKSSVRSEIVIGGASVGVADVRAFGFAWEDCEALLRQLGFSLRVEVVAA